MKYTRTFLAAQALLLLLSSVAWAAEPCKRGQQSISLGGLDMDVIQCRLALDTDTLGQGAATTNALQATLIIDRDDLANAQKAAAAAAAKLDWYKRAYDRQWPTAAKPKAPAAP